MEIDPHSFNAESHLIESMSNNDSSIIIPSKIDSLFDEFAGELTLLKSISPRIDETNCHPEEETHFTKRLLYDNSSPRPPEEFVSDNSNADIKSFSPSPIPIKDSDSHIEEIDLSLNPDEPNSRDFTKDVVEDISPTKEPLVLTVLPTHPTLQLHIKFQPSSESLFAYVVWIFLPFLVYSVVPCYLLSLRNEDVIFDLGICKSTFSKSDISHRYGTVKKFNTHRSHLNKCPMLFHGQNNPPLDEPLSMGDEHLDTIPATESDKFIKSGVENLIPIPSESEGILEHMCDVPFHDNSPPLDVSKYTIEDLSDSNEVFSSIDEDSFSINNIDYVEDVEASLPDSELVSSEVMDIDIPEVGGIDDDILLTIKHDVLHISSGSPTTHSDSSLYASFIFDLLINPFPPADMSDFYEFIDELIPFISALEYECFLFKVEPNSRDFTKDVVEDISPTKEPQVLTALPTHPTLQLNLKFQPSSESLFTYVVWIFLLFLVADISHRYGTVKKFNTHRSHLNECPMLIHGHNNLPLDVLLFYFYPLDSPKYGGIWSSSFDLKQALRGRLKKTQKRTKSNQNRKKGEAWRSREKSEAVTVDRGRKTEQNAKRRSRNAKSIKVL
nr:hypothetical protein [Tanacetum cinerariifolium]